VNFLKDITIRKSVFIILFVFCVAWSCVSAYTLISYNQLKNTQLDNGKRHSDIRIVNHGDDQYFRAVLRMTRANGYQRKADNEKGQKELSMAEDALQKTTADFTTFSNRDHQTSDPTLVSRMSKDWGTLINDALKPMMAAVKEKRFDDFDNLMYNVYPPLSRQFGASLDAYNTLLAQNEQNSDQQVIDLVDVNRIILIIALLMGFGALFLTDAYLVHYLVKPTNRLKTHLQALSEGQLSREIEDFGRNCVGQLIPYLRDLQSSLSRTVSVIRGAADGIYQNAQDINSGNSDLSLRTEEQAQALATTASSMEQLNATVKQNAENAQHASKESQAASLTAKRGGDIVSNVVTTMAQITESSRKIADINSVINSIAFQTNILALNAAVEAARAGEQGRGFAVVAGEVRSLAQRSATAAKEIETLIGESVSRVDAGSAHVAKAGETMQDIVQAVNRVTNIMAEIALASDEQSRGIGQIEQAITDLERVTQQNTSLVHASAQHSASLNDQAHNLSDAVQVFQINGVGGVAKTTQRSVSASKKVAPRSSHVKPAVSAQSDDDWQTF
jgi:methyl-accepting chemotaxis protein